MIHTLTRLLRGRSEPSIRRRATRRQLLRLDALEDRRLLTGMVFTVTSAGDDPSGPTSGVTTLRDAINSVNSDAADNSSNPDVINFNIAGTPTISLLANLPALNSPVTIDGSTQTGVTVKGNGFSMLVDNGTATINDATFTGGTASVASGATLMVSAGSTVAVTGDLDAGAGAFLANFGSLSVGGNFVDAGSIGMINAPITNGATTYSATFTVAGAFTAGDDSFLENNGTATFSVGSSLNLGNSSFLHNGFSSADHATLSVGGNLSIGTYGFVYNYGDSSLLVTNSFSLGNCGFLYNGASNTDDATLKVGGNLTIGADGFAYNQGGSSLQVTGAFSLGNDGFLYNGSSPTDTATLTIGGNFTIGDSSAGSFDSGFVFNEGDSSLKVGGNFTIYGNGGSFLFNGLSSTDAATLSVGGSFSLGANSFVITNGTMPLSVANNFTLGANSFFNDSGIISVGGTFDPGTGDPGTIDTVSGTLLGGPNSNVTTDAASWEVTSGGLVNVTGSFTVDSGGNVTIDSGGSLQAETLVLAAGGQVNANGSLAIFQVTGNPGQIATGSGGQFDVLTVNPVNIVYGTALNSTQLSGTFTSNGQSIPVAITFASAGTVLGAANGQIEAITFTPTVAGYPTVVATVPVNVARTTPLPTAAPVSITYGTPLSNGQLSGAASWTVGGKLVTVGGTFVYTSAAGTTLNAGNGQIEAVTFTPNDTTDYTTAYSTVTVNVLQAGTTSTIVTSSNNPAVFGQQVFFTAKVTNTSGTAAIPVGSIQFMVDGANFGASVAVNAMGQVTSPALSFLTGSSHAVKAIFTPSPNFLASNNSTTQVVQSIAVEPDPSNPALTDLFVGSSGASSSDNVQISPIGSSSTGSTGVQVQTGLNGVYAQTSYSQSFASVYIFLQAGNDNIQMASSLTISAHIVAGNGNDNLNIGSGNHVVTLGNGNDNLTLGAGNMVVTLGNGNDNLTLGAGNDNLTLGNGCDNLTLGAGNDNLTLGNGNDNLTIGAGNDVVTLGNGCDNLTLGAGNDTLTLGNGNDNVNLGNGNHVVTLGCGSDNVQAGTGNNTLVAGNGNDNVNLATGANAVTLGNGNDNITLGAGNDSVTAGSGNDNVNLGNGNSVVVLGSGNDNVNLGNGTNAVTVGNGNDNINAGTGTMTLVGGNGNDNVNLGAGNNDSVKLGNGNDNLTMGAGSNQVVVLGNGNDNVNLGAGSYDSVTVGSGTDNVSIGNGSNNTVIVPTKNKANVHFGSGNNNTIV
jgi:Ca2+-binding RTX toxin-like protein